MAGLAVVTNIISIKILWRIISNYCNNIGSYKKQVKKYLEEMDEDWDIIFDSIFSNFGELNEGDVLEDKHMFLQKIQKEKS